MSRRHLPMRLAAALGAILVGGCVYYNGMYNTKRWPAPPGRPNGKGAPSRPTTSGARSSPAPNRSSSAIPDSKYVDEALVLKGIALGPTRTVSNAGSAVGQGDTIGGDGVTPRRRDSPLDAASSSWAIRSAASVAVARSLESKDPAAAGPRTSAGAARCARWTPGRSASGSGRS